MIRLVVLLTVLVGCGDNSSTSTPDAAPLPDAAPDASVCEAQQKLCSGTCTSIDTDEDNCGDCGVTCKGGEACSGTCMCPTGFIPPMIEPGSFDQFMGMGGVTVAVSPNTFSGINPVLVGYTATTPLDTDIDLSMVPLGTAPFVAAGYGFDLGTMNIDASYSVTAGTLRLTKACGTEAEGTLTNATFQGVTGGFTNPTIDPDGCTFTITSLSFHMMTAACP